VQYAKAAGFETIAISHSPDKNKMIRKLGADEIVRDGKSLAAAGGAARSFLPPPFPANQRRCWAMVHPVLERFLCKQVARRDSTRELLPGPTGPCSGPGVTFAQGRHRFRGPSYFNTD
jgi:hypothetical protein